MLTPQQSLVKLKQLGWTQVKLAKKFKVGQATISNIKAGKETSYTVGNGLVALANKGKPPSHKKVSRTKT